MGTSCTRKSACAVVIAVAFTLVVPTQVACGSMSDGQRRRAARVEEKQTPTPAPSKGAEGPPAPKDREPEVRVAEDVDRGVIKAQANELGRAFVAGDFDKLADMTYPPIVEILGGKARMVSFLKESVGSWEKEGMTLVSVEADEPEQVLAAGDRRFAVVPTTLRMRVSEGTLVGESSHIAVSSDGGKTWSFIGTQQIDKQKLKILFRETPAVADRLELPPPKQPVLERGP